jgi:hypothetical protein
MYWINEKYKITPPFKKPVYPTPFNEEPFVHIREKLWANPQWIKEFVKDESGKDLTQDEQEILLSWSKNFIADNFIAIKQLKKYALLIQTSKPEKIYAVVGISQSLQSVARHVFPKMISVVLLPFKDKIIYDSFVGTYKISLGAQIRKSLKADCRKIQEENGIIETLKTA